MIDFKEELAKYAPVLDMDDIEHVVGDEITDIMDLLQYITQKITEDKPEDIQKGS